MVKMNSRGARRDAMMALFAVSKQMLLFAIGGGCWRAAGQAISVFDCIHEYQASLALIVTKLCDHLDIPQSLAFAIVVFLFKSSPRL